VKFHPVVFLFDVLDGADGVVRAAGDRKTRRNVDDVIAVAVPDFQAIWDAGEEF
jgi:hypothetical protein